MSRTAVTRITHSCHLIEIGGRTFLTDPWFSTRPGYYQGEPIALSVADLPRLDGVLISHEHYDHCDLETFASYRDQSVPLFVAETVVEAAPGTRCSSPNSARFLSGSATSPSPSCPPTACTSAPQGNMQVVMDADEAAELTAILKPELAIPHHYAFTKGFLGDRLITHSDKDPLHYQDAARDLAPETHVRIIEPGTRIEL